MRRDIRLLQGLVDAYVKKHKLGQEDFAKRGGEELTRGKVNYLMTGKASSIDTVVLASYARAMDVPLIWLIAKMGLIDPEASSREATILSDVQKVAAELEGTNKEIFLDKIEQIVEVYKRSSKIRQ